MSSNSKSKSRSKSKYLTIQENIAVENCIICGTRPVIEQRDKSWFVFCPKQTCKNEIAGRYVDLEGWNVKNKK